MKSLPMVFSRDFLPTNKNAKGSDARDTQMSCKNGEHQGSLLLCSQEFSLLKNKCCILLCIDVIYHLDLN